MSSKLLFATAIMAAGSFMFIDTADAQRRGGAERGGNGNVEAGQRRRSGARQNRGQRRNAQTNQAQTQRTPTARANRAPRAAVRTGRNHNHAHRGWGRPNPVIRGWRQARRWAGRTWVGRRYAPNRSCFAVARRAGGNGRVIRGINGDGYGRRACRKALRECNARLDHRQAYGRNPYARCVVASRW